MADSVKQMETITLTANRGEHGTNNRWNMGHEEPKDYEREEALPPAPRWHSIVFPFVLTLATMAVGGMAISWRDVAVLTSRVSALEQENKAFHTAARYTRVDADRDHGPMWRRMGELEGQIHDIEKDVTDLRVEVARLNILPPP